MCCTDGQLRRPRTHAMPRWPPSALATSARSPAQTHTRARSRMHARRPAACSCLANCTSLNNLRLGLRYRGARHGKMCLPSCSANETEAGTTDTTVTCARWGGALGVPCPPRESKACCTPRCRPGWPARLGGRPLHIPANLRPSWPPRAPANPHQLPTLPPPAQLPRGLRVHSQQEPLLPAVHRRQRHAHPHHRPLHPAGEGWAPGPA